MYLNNVRVLVYSFPPTPYPFFGFKHRLRPIWELLVQNRYNKTPVIKASGRELCYMLLTGILCCYCMSFIILAPPNILSCASLRVGIGLCLSICYSAIFIKTNRISRIFNQGVKSIQRPLYTSPISQVAISSGKLKMKLDNKATVHVEGWFWNKMAPRSWNKVPSTLLYSGHVKFRCIRTKFSFVGFLHRNCLYSTGRVNCVADLRPARRPWSLPIPSPSCAYMQRVRS